MNITVILTCFNRREKTLTCIRNLANGNPDYHFKFIIVDDNSSDGTVDAILQLNLDTEIVHGDGNLYWSGGMRQGIGKFLSDPGNYEYMLLVNDDVEFYPNIINSMVERSKNNNNAIIVGATCDENGEFSYGAQKLIIPRKRNLYVRVLPTHDIEDCDTFNCNCVLVKTDIALKLGNFDPVYRHSLADLDYGLTAHEMGLRILSTEEYIGVCNKNLIKGTWADVSLGRIKRIKLKESVKGSPIQEWFHFINKHFGFLTGIEFTVRPYIRILLGR